jgi:hypothetical protein
MSAQDRARCRVPCEHLGMRLARTIRLEIDARSALGQIVGIMSDQVMSGTIGRWDLARLIEIEARLGLADGAPTFGSDQRGDAIDVTLGIDDAALLLDGLAFTEIASADLPWIDMVRWTADFVSTELRRHWTDDEWLAVAAEA